MTAYKVQKLMHCLLTVHIQYGDKSNQKKRIKKELHVVLEENFGGKSYKNTPVSCYVH